MKKLRVLHLPMNTASIPTISSQILRSKHHKATVINTFLSKTYTNTGNIIFKDFKSKGILSKLIIRAYKSLFFIYFLISHDVIHYHSSNFFIYRPNFEAFLLNLFKKKAIVQFHGSEIRIPEIDFLDNIYFKLTFFKEKLHEQEQLKSLRSKQRYTMFEKITNKCIVNPDLVEHIDKSFFKKTYIVFHPIILEEVDPEYPEINREKPLVVHAPSRRWIKGTNYVLKAVELLKSKGFKFDFQLIEGMEHEKALNVLKNADIVVDQFIVGAYGMLSIEAMAYGKPVVCFIKESLYKLYPSTLPIVNANIDNLPQKLAMLIKDGNLRYRLGVEGRKYVEKYHSEEVYYKKIMEIYKNL